MAILHWLTRPKAAMARVRYKLWERAHPDQPWLCPETVAYLETILTPFMTAVEFGSGRWWTMPTVGRRWPRSRCRRRGLWSTTATTASSRPLSGRRPDSACFTGICGAVRESAHSFFQTHTLGPSGKKVQTRFTFAFDINAVVSNRILLKCLSASLSNNRFHGGSRFPLGFRSDLAQVRAKEMINWEPAYSSVVSFFSKTTRFMLRDGYHRRPMMS
jgi:hypothetical protein